MTAEEELMSDVNNFLFAGVNLTETTVDFQHKPEFESLVKDMSIPEMRKVFNLGNVLWFLRNAQIHNLDHLNFKEAKAVARNSLTFT